MQIVVDGGVRRGSNIEATTSETATSSG